MFLLKSRLIAKRTLSRLSSRAWNILHFHSVESDSLERIHVRERRVIAPLLPPPSLPPPPLSLLYSVSFSFCFPLFSSPLLSLWRFSAYLLISSISSRSPRAAISGSHIRPAGRSYACQGARVRCIEQYFVNTAIRRKGSRP